MSADPLSGFTPLFADWFRSRFREPTPPQARGWPVIRQGEHALVISPTGSGKTLAAFYACLDDLHAGLEAGARDPEAGVHTLYVSPLKALNNDIARNLRAPLAGLEDAARDRGVDWPEIRVAVRTGDTPQKERARMTRVPPHVLITTPESLALLVLSKGGRGILRHVKYAIVDEIHAIAGSKRGAHLALTLERLAVLQEDGEFVRVGLSATVRPAEEVARFLAGTRREARVIDAGARKPLDVEVVTPVVDFVNPPAETVWSGVYPKLYDLVQAHRTSIVFANNRRLAERVSARLNAMRVDPDGPPELSRDRPLAELVPGHKPHEAKKRQFMHEFVRAHHGSMSREARLEMESLLKAGDLPGLVATSSLELGIDVGHVDCVALLGSPKSVASALQRVGRSGHNVGETAKGRFFPLYRDDLVESAVIARAMREGDVEEVHVPVNALDVLAQQVVAAVAAADADDASDAWHVDALFDLVRGAYPYRDLPRGAFENVLGMLAGKYPSHAFKNLKPRVSWDKRKGTLTPMPGAKLLAATNTGTIPDRGYFRCVLATNPDVVLGELDEEFVYETRVGDVFLLGSQTWRAVEIDRDEVRVVPAPGEPPRMPFWRGEAVPRSVALSRRVGVFRRDVAALLDEDESASVPRMRAAYGLDEDGARAVLDYYREQREAVGALPSDALVVVEGFRDEIGDPRVVVHAPFGGRVTAAWGLVVAAHLRRKLDADVQVLSNDDGFILRFPDTDFPPDLAAVPILVDADDVEGVLLREMGETPVFAARFRENAERALLLPKTRGARRTPLWLQRLRAQDLLGVARDFDDFPVLVETYREVLTGVLDVDALKDVLSEVAAGKVRVHVAHPDVPSPFAQSLLFQFLGAFMYEYDRTRPDEDARAGPRVNRDLLDEVMARRDLRALLDADAIDAVDAELQHVADGYRARSPEELLHVLERVGALARDALRERARDAADADALLATDRVRVLTFPEGTERVVAREDVDAYEDAWAGESDAVLRLARRALAAHGPVTRAEIARETGVDEARVARAFDALAAEGFAVSGRYREGVSVREWCARDSLARVHRRSLARLREDVDAVPYAAFARFLARWHGVEAREKPVGPHAIKDALGKLEGLALPGDAWERDVLAPRVRRYDPRHAAEALSDGAWAWVATGEKKRFRPVARGRARAFVDERDPELQGRDVERDVLDALREHGALHLDDVRAATGIPGAAVGDALARLAHRGLVTNDHFDVMRHVMRTDPWKVKPKRAKRTGMRSFTGPTALGRWSLVRSKLRLGPELAPGDRALAVARTLLARYGVVARELAQREELPVPWREIAHALKRLEMRGDARRGYFVKGLGGLQFALPQAVDALRAAARDAHEDAPVVLVATLDPACAYGTGLPGVVRDRDGEPVTLARQAGVHVAVKAGRPVLVSETWGARVTRCEGAADAALVEALKAVGALADLPTGLRPRKRVTVESIDGGSPVAESVLPLFREAGFEVDAGRQTYWPSHY